MQNSDQTIDLSKFRLGKKLGEGSFGEVFEATEISTGIVYAAKISLSTIDESTRELAIDLLREVNINASMNHPSILRFIGFSPNNFENEKKAVIITELSANGALSDIIDYENRSLSVPGWDSTKKLIMIFGIASGMSYLHSHNLIHRDLKPENVLADDRLFPKISDFGFTKKMHNFSSASLNSIRAMKGTPAYHSPEIIEKMEYSKAGDVYAFGIVVYEIMMGKRAYEGFTLFKLNNYVMSGNRPEIDCIVPEAYKSLIERCWSQDPKDRPSFDQIVEELQGDDFITDFVEEKDFRDYVNFIKESKSTFDKDKQILRIEDFIRSSESKSFQKVSLQAVKKLANRNILPPKFIKDLSSSCRKLVEDSREDPDNQYLIGTYLVEGSDGFPQNVEYGIKYLERSSEEGCVDSALYLSDLYNEGKLIPQNIDKAKEYIYEKESSGDGRIYNEIGRIKKNECKLEESRKYYEKGASKFNGESMYHYGWMLLEGEGGEINPEEGMKFIVLSKNQECENGRNYMSIYDKMKKNQFFLKLPLEAQHLFIRFYLENKDNGIRITEKNIKILIDNNLLELKNFIEFMDKFSIVNIELTFPSDSFGPVCAFANKHKNIKLYVSFSPSQNSIMSYAFEGCSSLREITIPSSVTSIGGSAFSGCSSLTEITIPSSVTSIGDYAFRGCSSLRKITIPSSVTSIGYSAFSGCSSLREITIPSSVTSIGYSAFYGCSSLTEITIPSSVTSIVKSAFEGCSSLREITIPSSVTSIGNSSFSGCSTLREITISSSVTSIGGSAFRGCSSLREITIPSSVTSIGNSAFRGCSSLSEITIPSSVTSIDDSIFRGCSSLSEITIPSSVTSIDDFAFEGCSSLRKITIPSSVTSIGYSAFYECSSLSEITILSSVTSIGYSAFYGCSSLTEITIPSSVTSIGDYAFRGCSSLTEITIPSSVTSISDSAFYECSSLREITIPSSVTSIGNSAFIGCSSLRKITIPSSVTSIGDFAFSGCSSLTEITIPSSVTSIGISAYERCSSLREITIPSSVTSIVKSAFEGCSSLREITIPSSVTSIGNSAFRGCSSLSEITIPSSVTSIGDYAFANTLIRPFSIPPTVTTVGKDIFYKDKTCNIE